MTSNIQEYRQQQFLLVKTYWKEFAASEDGLKFYCNGEGSD